jgi:hypothetical protein
MMSLPSLYTLLRFPVLWMAAAAVLSFFFMPPIIEGITYKRRNDVAAILAVWFVASGVAAGLLYAFLNWRWGIDPGTRMPTQTRVFIFVLCFLFPALVFLYQVIRICLGWFYASCYKPRTVRLVGVAGALVLTILGMATVGEWYPIGPWLQSKLIVTEWVLALVPLLLVYVPAGLLAWLEDKHAIMLLPFYPFFWHWEECDHQQDSLDGDHYHNFIVFLLCCIQVAAIYETVHVMGRTWLLFEPPLWPMVVQHGGFLWPLLAAVAAAVLAWLAGILSVAMENATFKSGAEVDKQHEWRRVGSDRKFRDATVADVYDHQHKPGSWRASVKRQTMIVRIILTLAAAGLPVWITGAFLGQQFPRPYFVFMGMMTALAAVIAMVWSAVRKR